MAAAAEKFEFKTEVQKLLNIITHSLYTNREIFLRELVSNASDALDKLRFETNRGTDVRDADQNLEISITVDKDKKILTIADTGIGMTKDELIANIGTIAKSGSEDFVTKLAEQQKDSKANDAAGIIGRFGVGFYSVFMISDHVRLETQSFQKDAPALAWVSDGTGMFEIEELEGEHKRGTRIEVHLKEDAEEYLESTTLENIIKRHSSFISFPIMLEGEKINTIPALWREPKFSIEQEQYNEFYKFLTYDSNDPMETIHTAVDAPVQFNSLVFVPKQSDDFFGFDRKEYGLDLYVRRVLIQRQNKDLIPEYLSFIKGVVDTEDLPLNISRETLQENALIRKISQTLVKQILSHLEKMASGKPEEYNAFWKAHGKTFRLSYNDYVNREKISPLLRFNSSTHADADELTAFDDYIARAKTDQKEIYYISGPSREAINLNPHLEIFKSKGMEVLYLYEPVDEILMDSLREYKEFTFISVEHADLAKLGNLPTVDEVKPEVEALDKDDEDVMTKLLEKIKDILGDRVTETRISTRLSDSPCCLVSPDGGITSSMQKIMNIVGKDTSIPQKVLEVNPDHPLTRNLLKIFKSNPDDEHLNNTVEQLFESSLLLEGYLSDPHKMVERLNKMLKNSSDWYVGIKKI